MIRSQTETDGQIINTHELKTWPSYYELLEQGLKTFELRRDDRDFNPGDLLILREWDEISEQYTGRESTWEITSIFYPVLISDKYPSMGLEEGFVILSIREKRTPLTYIRDRWPLLLLILILWIETILLIF